MRPVLTYCYPQTLDIESLGRAEALFTSYLEVKVVQAGLDVVPKLGGKRRSEREREKERKKERKKEKKK